MGIMTAAQFRGETTRLSARREGVRKLFNRAEGTEEWDEYKIAFRNYDYAPIRVKPAYWRKYYTRIESNGMY